MAKRRSVRPVSPCKRCGDPVENPVKGSGRVPDGKGGVEDVRDLILCLPCLDLMYSGAREYWNSGWGLKEDSNS